MARRKLPPLVEGYPLVGSFLEVIREPFAFLTKSVRRYGDTFRVQVPGVQFYVLAHPEDIEYVFRGNHRNFVKDKGTRTLLSAVLGQGLVTSEGELWRRQRRLAQPAFQMEAIQKYSTVMVNYSQRMIERWKPGETRDVHAEMMGLTLEIVAQTLFSASVGEKAGLIGKALDALMAYWAGPGGTFSWWQYVPTPTTFRFREAVRQLDAVILEAVAQRRAGGPEHEDLLSRFLNTRDEDGSGMSDKQLRDEMMTLLLAGHETTAVALSFCFYLLAKHPEVDARLAAELKDVLGEEPPSALHIPRLRYTEWVIKEAMRLFPPVPVVAREAIADCEIGGYRVPRGAQVALCQWVTHRDRRWFGADADKFRPERWDNDFARQIPRCAYFPFADGPRGCIGNHFAMMEAVLILATVASKYRLTLAPGCRLRLLPSVTLRPRGGVRMKLHERGNAIGVSSGVVAGGKVLSTS